MRCWSYWCQRGCNLSDLKYDPFFEEAMARSYRKDNPVPVLFDEIADGVCTARLIAWIKKIGRDEFADSVRYLKVVDVSKVPQGPWLDGVQLLSLDSELAREAREEIGGEPLIAITRSGDAFLARF
jgi:hypothetical protein